MRLLLIAGLLFCTAAFAEKPLFSAEDIFRLTYASEPQVSPDGSFIVYTHNFMDVMDDRRRSNLWRIDTDGKNARPITTGAVNDKGAQIVGGETAGDDPPTKEH